MANLAAICFLDVSIATANLLVHHKVLIEKDETDLIAEHLKKWKSGASLIAKVKKVLEGRELIDLRLQTIKPGAMLAWETDLSESGAEFDRFELCLVPSFGAMVYSGIEQAAPAVGWLTYINHRIAHSAVNLGTNHRVHLVVHARKPDSD